MKQKMDTKKLLVSVFMIASIFMLVGNVVASDLAQNVEVKIDDMYVESDDVSVIAGETLTAKVYFNAINDSQNVKVKVEIEGDRVDVSAVSEEFDVEAGKRYSKALTIKIPYELKDEVSDDLNLRVKIWNGDFSSEYNKYAVVRVQRPNYNANVVSIVSGSSVEAGKSFPVDVIVKNTGYNNLDDLFVTVRVPELGLERKAYFGDLLALECVGSECDDDDEDTVTGRLTVAVPYNAEAGVYAVEVEASNSDLAIEEVQQIVVKNTLAQSAIRSGNELIVVNPTDNVKVYTVVTPTEESIVVVPAGSSKSVEVSIVDADNDGTYNFDVVVLSGNEVVSTTTFSGTVEKTSVTSPIVVLTVILAIIFLVLLAVLIVLIGKKPEKADEFGESYY